MWIVKNLIKGTLVVEDLDLRVAAGDFYDLDKFSRERAEQSESLRLAFEEGYLQSIVKEGAKAGDEAFGAPSMGAAAFSQNEIAAQLAELRMMMQRGGGGGGGGGGGVMDGAALGADIKSAMSGMAQELVGGLKDEFKKLAAQRVAIGEEKAQVVSAKDMSEAEIRARLALLDSKEQELSHNLAEIGKQIGNRVEGDGQADAMADLLGDI